MDESYLSTEDASVIAGGAGMIPTKKKKILLCEQRRGWVCLLCLHVGQRPVFQPACKTPTASGAKVLIRSIPGMPKLRARPFLLKLVVQPTIPGKISSPPSSTDRFVWDLDAVIVVFSVAISPQGKAEAISCLQRSGHIRSLPLIQSPHPAGGMSAIANTTVAYAPILRRVHVKSLAAGRLNPSRVAV